jgi:hypothetical protein
MFPYETKRRKDNRAEQLASQFAFLTLYLNQIDSADYGLS